MIKSQSHNLTLAYCEVAAIEEYLYGIGKRIHHLTNGASFSANHDGITIHCTSEQQADKLWAVILTATDDTDEDG